MYFVIFNKVRSRNQKKLSYCSADCNTTIENGKLICDCGNDFQIFEWCWEKDDAEVNFQLDCNDLGVTFHPVYSSGTAVVRGNKSFQKNMHYYWEIKIISSLYGTDVMVGVGTDKTKNFKFRFCSMLGSDDQSWGYSYRGNIQHNNLTRNYGRHYDLGCIIGVHLDMYTGRLEYYLNRKPLGIAFDGLKKEQLYPMACSTSAKTSMILNCAVSQEQTLQMLCLKCVQQHKPLFNRYRTIPGLYNYYHQKYFWMVPREDKEAKNKTEEDDELHLMTINNSSSLSSRQKRLAEYVWNTPNKKITRRNSSESQSQDHPDSVSVPSSSTLPNDRDLETKDVCELIYDCLSDPGIENSSDNDSVDIVDGDLDLFAPSEDDSD